MYFHKKHQDESVYLNENLEIQNIKKHLISIKNKKDKANKDEDQNENLLTGLTFNVLTSSNDLEVKKNLVLPYEIIGQEFLILFTFLN
jgi:hypothetical protein